MKTINRYPHANFLATAFVLIFALLSTGIRAQCPDVENLTLTTQAEIDNWNCSTFDGNLTITGPDISDLDPLVTGTNAVLTNVTGNLTITNLPNLTSLVGLDAITSVGGSLNITNLPAVTTWGDFTFQLNSVGSFFNMHNLPLLQSVNRLTSLHTIGNVLSFAFNNGITDFTGLSNLTSCSTIEFFGLTQSSINAAFPGINNLNWLIIQSNNASSFNGMTNLQTITPNPGLGRNGTMQIVSNTNLSNLTMGANFTSVEILNITSNPQLSTCCFALPILDNAPASVSISGNAFGCSSVAQIDAPPTLSACPPNQTVSVGAGSCSGFLTTSNPIATDNCDFSSYQIGIRYPGGGTSAALISSGGSYNFTNLPQGVSTATYRVDDSRGHFETCTFLITVEDNEAPVIANIPASVTINCNDPFPSIPSPLITDNCDGSPQLTASSSLGAGPCGLGEIVETQSFTWTATDASGNTNSKSWQVTRLSDFAFNLGPDINLCNDGSTYELDPETAGNNSYQWSTGASSAKITIGSSGTYSLTVTTENGCCYVDEIEVNFVSPPDATAVDAILDCGAANTQLTGMSSTTGANYTWAGPGGFTSSEQNPLVTNIGEYTLTVTSPEGCVATDVATVTGDTALPDASAVGGVLNCAVSSIQLMGSSATAGATYSWTGPESFTSSEQNPMASTSGIYILTVKAPNGCELTADAEVLDNTQAPNIVLNSGTLDCNNTELLFTTTSTASWSGPDNFSELSDSVTLSVPGTYAVTLTAANFCTSDTTFEVVQDISPPDISAEGGTINCSSGQDTLKGNSDTEGATFLWSGPGDFSTDIQNPIAAAVGTYTLIVTGPNGCTSTQDVELIASLDAPEVAAVGGTVDCVDTMVALIANSESEGLTYSWIGPDGFTAEGDTVMASQPGSYSVVALNEDGCAGNASTEIINNAIVPTVSIFADSINCFLGVSKFNTIVSDTATSFLWTGPNNFTSTDKEPEVSMEGEYMVTVSAENGCSDTASYIVISDIENPVATATGGLLTCTQNTLTIQGSTTTPDASFSWMGPDNFTSDVQNPIVTVPGTYFFSVIAPNGCEAVDSAIVEGDPDFPLIVASGGKIDCTNDDVTLLGSTQSEGATISWEGPNGFASTKSDPVVDIPGTYKFTVVSSGGCIVFSEVQVELDTRNPDLILAEGRINCEEGTRQLDLTTNSGDAEFAWEGPDGFSSTLQKPQYNKAGTYMVTITGTNGCVSSGSIIVASDVNYEANVVTSGNDATIEISGGTAPFVTSIDDVISGREATDLAEGDHFARVIDGLGCERIIAFTIMSTSVFDLEEKLQVKVYPNPALDQIIVDWTDSDVLAKKLTIINSNGQVQETKSVSGKRSFTQNVDDYPSGVYYIRIEGENTLTFKKFLKM